MAKGDGIESRGKTKGKQFGITGPNKSIEGDVAKGGKAKSVTSSATQAMGRNIARAKNQSGGN